MSEVYHNGEKQVQQLTGEERIASSTGRVITDTIIKGAINFIEKQPMAFVSSSDEKGQVWASVLVGDFGFTGVPNPNALSFNQAMIYSSKEDIFYQNIVHKPLLGSLFIELGSRRRFRINGQVKHQGNHLDINIDEAYPNCPKYIQRRVAAMPAHFQEANAQSVQGTNLTVAQKEWIDQADTFFVGSSSGTGTDARLDMSHRGGNPGFIGWHDEKTLKIPDYKGNSMYNTLGNFAQYPAAGLLFIDFEKGSTLQLTGQVKLLFDQTSEEDMKKTAGTGRYWLFEIGEWIETQKHHEVNWELLDYSPFNP